MKNIKLFSFVLTVLSVVFGALGLAAPASAATGDGDFHFTVVSAAYDYDQADLTVTNETRATINGATQLTWWFPNHNIKVSVKSVKKAPHIKVRYVGCAKQSKWIAKKTHGAPIVVAMPGSQMCNTGKNGNIVGGFKWTVTTAAVLKWNKQLGLYQHVFNWKNHKLDKTCGNHIGGHVDVMYNNVVQVQYEQDVQMNGTANAKTGVHTDVNFGVTCPNGAYFNVSAGGFAYGYASANISYTERTRSTVLAGKKPGLTHDSQVNGQATAVSDARLSIDVSGSCGSTPPPSYQAPTASGNAQACVQSGQQNGVITASGTNPNSVAAPGTLTVGGQSHSFTSVGAGQTVNWDFSGYAPGDYQGSFTLGSPVNMSASFTVHVAECPTPVHQNPTAEIFVGEHAVDLYGTMPVFGRVKAFDGATATLGSPVVTPSDLGMISNWRTVSTERDGVTPCETGYVCYQGTFRVTKDGTPGTYVYGTLQATATDTMGGTFTTPPLQFSVYYANHPNT